MRFDRCLLGTFDMLKLESFRTLNYSTIWTQLSSRRNLTKYFYFSNFLVKFVVSQFLSSFQLGITFRFGWIIDTQHILITSIDTFVLNFFIILENTGGRQVKRVETSVWRWDECWICWVEDEDAEYTNIRKFFCERDTHYHENNLDSTTKFDGNSNCCDLAHLVL